jgi:DNA-binding PadR family transcriptional regulator
VAEALLCEAPVAPYPVEELKRKLEHAKPGKVLRILATAPIPPRCKVLLQALWCRAVWRSGEVHPSTTEADLLAETAMNRRTLYRALADLEKAELLERDRAYGRRRARYRLTWMCERRGGDVSANRVSPRVRVRVRQAVPLPFQPRRQDLPSPSLAVPLAPPQPPKEETPSSPARERREGDSRFAQEQPKATIGAEAPPTTATTSASKPGGPDGPADHAAPPTATLTDDQAEAARILEEVPTVEGRRRLTRPDAERFARKHALPIVRLAIDRAIAWGRDPLAVVIATLTRPERVGALEAELQDRARDREREAAILQAGRDAAERMEREFQEEVEAFLQDPRVRADPLVARALANASKARAEKSECGF